MFQLRGIIFKGIHDVSGLSEDEKKHLAGIHSIIYLRNNVRPAHLTYAVLRLSEDAAANRSSIENLYIAQLMVSYLYTSPHHWDGKPFFPAENACMFVFEPTVISRIDVEQERYAEPYMHYYLDVEPDDDPSSPFDEEIEGYWVGVNGRFNTTVARGSRLYPPYHGVYLNYSQILGRDLDTFFGKPADWALAVLVRKKSDPTPEESRVLTAMEWYQRSAEGGISEEEALLHLAIALESLLGLDQGNDHTARFKETVLILLGRVERLDLWIEQFYKARSKIVHQGHYSHLAFSPRSKNSDSPNGQDVTSRRKSDSQPLEGTLGPLASYGRLIFRLCLNARLAGITATEESVLSALLTDNETRLKSICAKLNQTREPGLTRIRSIARQVSELAFYWAANAHDVSLNTAVAVGRLLVAAYVETNPPESDTLRTALDELSNMTKTNQKYEHVIKTLALVGDTTEKNANFFNEVDDPTSVLRAYLRYIRKLPRSVTRA